MVVNMTFHAVEEFEAMKKRSEEEKYNVLYTLGGYRDEFPVRLNGKLVSEVLKEGKNIDEVIDMLIESFRPGGENEGYKPVGYEE